MKSILIIGLGRLGHHLCENMIRLGNEVMIVDKAEEKVEDLLPIATNAKIGDCTNEEVLRSLGIGNFDVCFVCIGSNFQSSLEITSLVKDLGARYVVSKANRDIHAKFLLRNGADEVIYPDKDVAERLAVKHSTNNVFDYIELADGYSIFEISPMRSWIGRSIRDMDIRSRYHVSVLGIKVDEHLQLLPRADYVMKAEDHLMVIGLKRDVDKMLGNSK